MEAGGKGMREQETFVIHNLKSITVLLLRFYTHYFVIFCTWCSQLVCVLILSNFSSGRGGSVALYWTYSTYVQYSLSPYRILNPDTASAFSSFLRYRRKVEFNVGLFFFECCFTGKVSGRRRYNLIRTELPGKEY